MRELARKRPPVYYVKFLAVATGIACAVLLHSGNTRFGAYGTADNAVLSARTVRFDKVAGVSDPNEIFELVNQRRSEAGLTRLRANTKLAELARARAEDMAGRNYYAHRNPEGQYYYDLLNGTGFDKNLYSCENLDLQFTDTPGQYVADWMDSNKGHRECLLAARATDAGYASVATHQFGSDRTAYIVVAIHAQSK